jgi:uroporphyrinogen-III decarboxylase
MMMAATMTCRERLLAAIRHEDVDRVPCSPRLGPALRILYDDRTTEDLALRAASTGDIALDPTFYADTGIPNVLYGTGDAAPGLDGAEITTTTEDEGDCLVVTRTFHTPAGQMREVRKKPKPGHTEYGSSPDPAHLEHMVKGPDDLDKVRYLVPDPAHYDIGAQYHEMVERVGEFGLVAVCVRSPFDLQLGFLRAVEDLMVDYYVNRPFFDELCRMWFEKMMAETKAVLEKGAKAVLGSWYFTSLSTGWSPAMFREVFLPMIAAHVDLVHSYDAVYDYYDDGKCMAIIDMIKEARVDVLETLTPPPVGDVDLAEVKRRIGDSVCLKGYGDLLYVIKKGSPEDVENMVSQAMEIAAPGSGFIMGTSDSIREDTPRENIRAYFDAVLKYGTMHAGR